MFPNSLSRSLLELSLDKTCEVILCVLSKPKKQTLQTSPYCFNNRKRRRSESDVVDILHPNKKQKTDDAHKQKEHQVNEFPTINDNAILLKTYLRFIPHTIWSHLASKLFSKLRKIQNESNIQFCVKQICEVMFCHKLSDFFTSYIPSDLLNKMKDIIFEKLKLCFKLRNLEINCEVNVQDELDLSLRRMKHLRSLKVIPFKPYSFHWIIPNINILPNLREIEIVYDNSDTDITFFEGCKNLKKLILYSYGNKCETKNLIYLLKHINVNVFYHKELSYALLQLSQVQKEKLLNLTSLNLCNWTPSIGYQLVYIPIDFIENICEFCPNIKSLSVVNPDDLSSVLSKIQLHYLAMQQGSFDHCIEKPLTSKLLASLKSLELQFMTNIYYKDIEILSQECINLEFLELIGCNISAAKPDTLMSKKNPFPKLKTLVVLKSLVQQSNPFGLPVFWHIGKRLCEFFFRCLALEKVTIEFGDMPYGQSFSIGHTFPKNLEKIDLYYPPSTVFDMIWIIVNSCPKLVSLGTISTWNLKNEQKDSLIRKYGHIIE